MPAETVRRTSEGRFYDVLAGEDERGGGALLYFRLKRPLPITDLEREYPASLKFLEAAQERPDAWVDIEKPFWKDVPLWLASGLADSIGIAHNHMWRVGVLDNEAWGRARDLATYPGPHGNALWTQDIYYHALNCGVQLPPTAGSASGVLPNPVGYNRCYVHVEEPLTYDRWWDALREGKVFVTNGPLLLATVDQQLPGARFKAAGQQARYTIAGRVDSRDPLDRIEVIHNGRVVATIAANESCGVNFEETVTVETGGWLVVRAITTQSETFRFASTGPFWIEMASRDEAAEQDSRKFFLNWARQRRAELAESLRGSERDEVLAAHDAAIAFWNSGVR